MSIDEQIRQILIVALEPTRLDVVNESYLHSGHANSPGTGESHYRILVVSPAFRGKSRIERHRLINDALGPLLRNRIHALAIKAFAPDEKLS